MKFEIIGVGRRSTERASAGDQHPAVRQQRCRMTLAGSRHVRTGREVTGGRVIEHRRVHGIPGVAGAAGEQHIAICEQRSRMVRANGRESVYRRRIA